MMLTRSHFQFVAGFGAVVTMVFKNFLPSRWVLFPARVVKNSLQPYRPGRFLGKVGVGRRDLVLDFDVADLRS
jgi:hypothetical protein